MQIRNFLKVTALAGGGVMLGLVTDSELLAQGRGGAPPAPPNPNNYIKVAPDGTVLARAPEFRVAPADECPAEARGLIGGDGFLRCLPHVHDTDGFFAARLVRRP